MEQHEKIPNQEVFIHNDTSVKESSSTSPEDALFSVSEETRIAELKKEIVEIPPAPSISSTEKGTGFVIPKKLKTGMLASLFTIGSLFTPKESKAGDKESAGKPDTKIEASARVAKELNASTKGLAFYKGGIEKTPTGQNNAFENNPFGISKEAVYEIAQKYNFNTTTNLDLQKDMYAYLEAHRPDVLQKMYAAYGQTNAATFEDGILGSRTAFVMHELQTPPTTEKSTPTPEKKITPETSHHRVAFDKSYIINVRGDGGDGAYYVVENEAALKHIENLINGGMSSVLYRDHYGQLTIDMNKTVFLSDSEHWMNTPEKRALLGNTWHRDPKNPEYIIEDSK